MMRAKFRSFGFLARMLIVAGLLLSVAAGSFAAARKLPIFLYPASPATQPDGSTDEYWLHARQEVYRSTLDILTQQRIELHQNIRYHKLIHGNAALKQVALTFDDGPHAQYTPQLLAILRRYHVRATFFVVGKMAEQYPYLIRAEIADGHSVGNHTYNHVNLTKISEANTATEIQACDDVLFNITGEHPHLFRPPGGDYNTQVAMVSEAMHYTMVLWTDDPGDYASPGDGRIESRLMSSLNNGGIILLHDGIRETIDILPHFIATLQAEGYQFVTVDELMKQRPHGETASLAKPVADLHHHE